MPFLPLVERRSCHSSNHPRWVDPDSCDSLLVPGNFSAPGSNWAVLFLGKTKKKKALVNGKS